MRFLLKVAFWLTIVVLLLPTDPAKRDAERSAQVGPFEAFGAAQAAVEDATTFCLRRPEACEVGSQAFHSFGEKAQHGAKLLYDFLSERFDDGPDAHRRSATGSIQTKEQPGRHTLTPADLEPVWHEPRMSIPLPPRRPA